MRKYYSTRSGSNPNAVLNLDVLRKLAFVAYSRLVERGYFQESFGYYCIDADEVPGTLGANLREVVLFALRKDIWPFSDDFDGLAEDDLFDVIEFLHDHSSLPVDGSYHQYNQCGQHWTSFDTEAGRRDFRDAMNVILADYEGGWELDSAGELLRMGDTGLNELLSQPIPEFTEGHARERIESAIRKWRVRGATPEGRRDAVRDLADVLEFLRPKLTEALFQKDESDLFNIANNFALRHWNDRQKSGYDANIWMTWMFYVFLATLHVVLRVLKRAELTPGEVQPTSA